MFYYVRFFRGNDECNPLIEHHIEKGHPSSWSLSWVRPQLSSVKHRGGGSKKKRGQRWGKINIDRAKEESSKVGHSNRNERNQRENGRHDAFESNEHASQFCLNAPATWFVITRLLCFLQQTKPANRNFNSEIKRNDSFQTKTISLFRLVRRRVSRV